jgi:hypothetical protein
MSEKVETNTQELEKPAKVDELSGVYFSTAIKIYDPNTEEVLVQIRGDN